MRTSDLGWMRQTGTARYAAFSPSLYYEPEELFGGEFGTIAPHGQGNMLIPTPPEGYPSEVFGLGQGDEAKKDDTVLRIIVAVLSTGAVAGGTVILLRYPYHPNWTIALGAVLLVGGLTGLRISLRPFTG